MMKRDPKIARHSQNKKIPTLVVQQENIYWISFIEDNPNERWTGTSIGDAIQYYLDRVCPDRDISLTIKIRRTNV